MIQEQTDQASLAAEIDRLQLPFSAPHDQDVLIAAEGGSISFAGRLFEYMVRFVFGIVIARAIGVEQFGLYTLSITVALIATNMAMLGLQTGMMRFLTPAIRDKEDRVIWGIIQVSCGLPFLLSLALSAGVFLFAAPISNFVFNDSRLIPLLKFISVLIPFDTLGSMAYVVTLSFKKPQYSALANNLVAPLAKLFLATVFLAMGLSTLGVLAAQIIASLFSLGVLIYYVNSLFALRRPLKDASRNLVQLLRYSLPVYLGWIVNTVSTTLSTIVLGFLGMTSGVGVFAAASRFSNIGTMFYLSIGNISTPIIADLHSHGESIQMKAYYQTTTRWLVMFNVPVFLTSLLLAKPLLSIFGDDFTTGAATMIILAIGTLAYTGTGVGANILDMTDHPKVNTTNSILMVFVTIALNWFLVPLWGIVGAAVASSIPMVLVNIICLIEVWALLGMQPYNRSFLKPVFAGLLAAVVAYSLIRFLNPSSLLLHLFVGGGTLWGVYAFVLYILKFSPEDQVVIERLLSRIRYKLPIATRRKIAFPSVFFFGSKRISMQISPHVHHFMLKAKKLSFSQALVFPLSIFLGLGLGLLISMGDWLYALALVALAPLAILFCVRPFIGVVLWLLLMPLISVLPNPGLMYWAIYRILIPVTMIMAISPHLVKAPGLVHLKLGLPELSIVMMAGLVPVSILLTDISTNISWNKYIDMMLIPFCMYLAVRFITLNKRDLQLLQWTAFAIIIIQSIIGLMSWVTPQLLPRAWYYLMGVRTAGSLTDPAVFTSMLIFCATLLFYAAMQQKAGLIRSLFLFACGVSFICVFISLERGSWLAGGFVFLGLFVLYPRTMLRFTLIAAIAITILAGGLLSKQVTLATQRIGEQGQINARIVVTDAMIRMIQSKPLFGWGYNTLNQKIGEYFRQVGAASMGRIFTTSHNTYLTILTELGLIGFLLYIFPVLWLFTTTVRVWRELPKKKTAGVLLLSTFWLAALHNFVVSNFMDMRFFPIGLTLWWMTLGLIANLLNLYSETKENASSKQVLQHRGLLCSFSEPLLENNGK